MPYFNDMKANLQNVYQHGSNRGFGRGQHHPPFYPRGAMQFQNANYNQNFMLAPQVMNYQPQPHMGGMQMPLAPPAGVAAKTGVPAKTTLKKPSKLRANAKVFVPKGARKRIPAAQPKQQKKTPTTSTPNPRTQQGSQPKASAKTSKEQKAESPTVIAPKPEKPSIVKANGETGDAPYKGQIPPRTQTAPLPSTGGKPVKKLNHRSNAAASKQSTKATEKKTAGKGDPKGKVKDSALPSKKEEAKNPKKRKDSVEAGEAPKSTQTEKDKEKAPKKEKKTDSNPKPSESKREAPKPCTPDPKQQEAESKSQASGNSEKKEDSKASAAPAPTGPAPKPQGPRPKPQASGPQMPKPKTQLSRPAGPAGPAPRPQGPQPKSQMLGSSTATEQSSTKYSAGPVPRHQGPQPKSQSAGSSESSSAKYSAPRTEIQRYQPRKPKIEEDSLANRLNRDERPKQVYDRKDLLKFSSQNKSRPEDLPMVSAINAKLKERASASKRPSSDNRRQSQYSNGQYGRKQSQFDRQGSRQSASRGQERRGNGGRRERRDTNRRRGGDFSRENMFLPPVKKLEKGENRFRVGTDRVEKTDENEKTEAAFLRVLNKICPENFEKIVTKVVEGNEKDLVIDSKPKLDMTARITFEKAIAELVFCSTYAQFCYSLWKKLPSFDAKTFEKIEVDSKKQQKIYDFRRVILDMCQREFSKFTNDTKAEASSDLSAKELESKQSKAKVRILGTIRLIGELYIRNMITERIIKYCTDLLSKDPVKAEFIQALCKLLETIGKKLDRDANDYTNALFKRLDRVKNSPTLDNRHKFMVDDSIELRARKWKPRRKKEEAMKKKELHKSIAEEEANQSARAAQMGRMSRPVSRRQISGPSSAARKKRGDDEWTTAGSGSRLRNRGNQDARVSDKRIKRRTAVQRIPSRQKFEFALSSGGFGLLNSEPPTPKDEPVTPSEEQKHEEGKEDKKSLASAPSKEDAQKKISALLNEYFDARDFNEVLTCIDELQTPEKFASMIVEEIILKSVDKSGGIVPMQEVLLKLCEKKILPKKAIEEGFKNKLKDAEELGMDYPLLLGTMGGYFGSMVCKGFADASFVATSNFTANSIEWGEAAKFVIGFLKTLRKEKGTDEAFLKFYNEAKFDIYAFMRPRHRNAKALVQLFKDKKAPELVCLEGVLK
eukprot:CAMPEP_0114517012 /NCGR_PEP_ID=MMETSP0109-20121206/17656_1 /TAXON_ID=29199 /ORGANISM="Chlorarachnion reptans, Strain CCCM449" /LENGTH=1169 /DNA_ID=CAMNT_0001697483 /DNA_START=259 /DNA_END=3768 /DNA_ORIENTATION=+